MAGNAGRMTQERMIPDVFDKMYGAVWMFEKIAENCGLMDDLYELFGDTSLFPEEVLTLAIYLYLGKDRYSYVARWQDLYKTPTSSVLDVSSICGIMRRIDEEMRVKLLQCRLRRLSECDRDGGETTDGMDFGKCLLNIGWCENEMDDE